MPSTARHLLIALLAVSMAPLAAEAVSFRLDKRIYTDAKGTALRLPEGLACGPDGLLVVADTGNSRLLKYRVTPEEIAPELELRVSQATYPLKVRIDAGGDLLVLDGKSKKLVRLSESGEFKGYVELRQGGSGGTIAPRSFDVDARGNIYLLDVAGGRVIVHDGAGVVQREISFADDTGFLSDLAVSADGQVFAVESVGRRVFAARGGESALRPLAALENETEFPTSVTTDAEGYIYVADQYGGRIIILEPNGAFAGAQLREGWKDGLLRYPSGLCASGRSLFVADRGNNRVQVFSVTH